MAVPSAYQTLLSATLSHLEELKAQGVQFVEVSPATLAGLNPPASVPAGAVAGRRLIQPSAAAASRTPPGPSRPMPSAPVTPPRPISVAPTDSARMAEPASTPAPAPVSARLPRGEVAAAPAGDRVGALAALRERARVCELCPHLVRSRTQVVFGVGSAEAELMFVGEAPGAEEDKQGEPFVGPAGQLLTKIITAMGFSRETVYIANILKCRPDVSEGAWGNRAPRPAEMDTCKPYLLGQIDIIRPKVIVALGLTAVNGLLGSHGTMGSVRGRWFELRGIPVLPTFHPSYLLRSEDQADRGFGEKRKTWEDMLVVLERLGRPITDKMRGFFRRPPPAGG